MKEHNESINLYVKNLKKTCKIKKLRKKLICFITIVFIMSYFILSYISKVVNPIIYNFAEQTISRIVSLSCNDAISQISNETIYDNLITIGYDSSGCISYIRANSANINKISNKLANNTQLNLDDYFKLGYSIPFGTLTGIGFLSGRGSSINFSINQIGNVFCRFQTTFTKAGINQTNHRIYVIIECETSIVLPFKNKYYKKQAEFLISECVIVGKIPSTYFEVSSLEQLA